MSAYAGTGTLLRLWLRRDRIMLPFWLYALTGYVASTALGFRSLYDTPASIHDFASGITSNGAMLAFYGELRAETLGGLVSWRLGSTGGAMVAVMAVFLVIRHTRAEEETGRLELVGSTAIGRRTALTAGLLVGVGAAVTLGVLASIVLIACGLPVAGSLAFAAGWTAVGLVFSAVAAAAAQFTENTRTARGLALAAVGASFALRAVGDAGPGALSWLSPLGWTGELAAYAGERWWVLFLPLAATAALTAAAYGLADRRDLGAGLLPTRLGPATGTVRGVFGLAARLQRGTLLAWTAGFALYGAAIGGIAEGADDLVRDSGGTREILERIGGSGAVTDTFLSAMFGIIGLLVSAYGVQTALRLRGEETDTHLELLLATPARRPSWTLGHLVWTFGGIVVVLAACGLAAGTVRAASTGASSDIARLTGVALAQAPAAWTVAGAAVLLFGLVPRASQAAWGVLAAFGLLGQFGPLLELPQPVMDLSPFTHTPHLPGADAPLVPLVWLALTALVVTVAGIAGFTRRDLMS
ncbi:ABC transporter permease [Actinocorallia longicatena]|uniref:Exporter of polyketide antibiotics n=1 Tax=Actinocorallia longicatena TaxID=111803 RepID=A0ABP6QJM5_9ACTN